ncbi:MAG: aminoacyl-tRNA hydrolase [SAR324 cluster bacterium]|nr:aminoacyl-tRNA hydrolase [SAR324 cluster bacterium]
MKLIVGLGNPGAGYEQNRHNIGFLVLDQLAKHLGGASFREKFHALIAKSSVGSENFILMKPLTFMNNSGQAVVACMNFFKISVNEVAIIYDDLDLPTGKVRFRVSGGHGGHNGIRSIIQHLKTQDFKRIRFGIGRPPQGMAPRDYVLSNWNESDKQQINQVQEETIPHLMRFISHSEFKDTSLHAIHEEN